MQELEKILREIDETIERYKENANAEAVDICYGMKVAKKIIRNHMNDGWIPAKERLPEDGTDVLVVLKPTYESDYIEYSIARYLRFENDEAHWCDNHYGYLEWKKYSDGHGGSSWYRVVAWQKLDSYHPERSDNHDGE